MDKLAPEKQAEIKKMSTERLVACLIKAGQDEKTVSAMDRKQLLDAWAELVATGQDKPAKPIAVAEAVAPIDPSTMADPDLQKRRLEFEMMRYQEEREERRRREEREWRMREEEREERRRREEEERKIREEERRIREEERRIREEEREEKRR